MPGAISAVDVEGGIDLLQGGTPKPAPGRGQRVTPGFEGLRFVPGQVVAAKDLDRLFKQPVSFLKLVVGSGEGCLGEEHLAAGPAPVFAAGDDLPAAVHLGAGILAAAQGKVSQGQPGTFDHFTANARVPGRFESFFDGRCRRDKGGFVFAPGEGR